MFDGKRDWLIRVARFSRAGDLFITHTAAFAVGVIFALWITGQL